MTECEKCEKDFYFDCNQEPCNKITAISIIGEEHRMKKGEYKAKGILMNWRKIDGKRPTVKHKK